MGQLLNIKQVAHYLQVHEKTIYKWIKQGRFPKPLKRWGFPRWDPEEVLSYLRRRDEGSKKVAGGSI